MNINIENKHIYSPIITEYCLFAWCNNFESWQTTNIIIKTNKEYKIISKRFKLDWEANKITETENVIKTEYNENLNPLFLTIKNIMAKIITAIPKKI